MTVKLKTKPDGSVSYYLLTVDSGFVQDLMPERLAEYIITNGETTISNLIKGYPLVVDNKYYFSAKILEE